MNEYLSPSAQIALRHAILEADGNEIFCLGRTDEARLVVDVEVLARGNRMAVPAVLQACDFGDVVIHNHPGGHLEPSTPDVAIAGQLGSLGVGFYIVDNRVEQLYRVVEAFAVPAREALDFDRVAELLGPDGSISRALTGYEERPEQLRMAFAVAEAFNDHRIGLVEAGTGTGKSLAYLVPAVLWGLDNRERVVISTNTINLQEQLVRKDLPLLQQATGLEFRFELVKGRSNYLCRRRLAGIQAEPGLFDEDHAAELTSLTGWAAQTEDGSREDLSFIPRPDLWEEVCCEADQCSRARCGFFGPCFFHQARRQAAQADLLVVNHALLLADLALRQQTDNFSALAVLPPFSRLILDEGHHLEEVATRYFSTQVTRFGFFRALNRLRHSRKPHRGLLPRLLAQLSSGLAATEPQLFQRIHTESEALTRLRQEVLDLSNTVLDEVTLTGCQLSAENLRADEEIRQRLIPRLTEQAEWQDVCGSLRGLVRKTEEFSGRLRDLLKSIRRLPQENATKVQSIATDLAGVAFRLEALAEHLLRFVAQPPGSCAWFEILAERPSRGKGRLIRLCTAPLEVAPLLREALFDRLQTVILTSATLTVADSFAYLRRRTGLDQVDPQRVSELRLDSPFDYRRQAQLLAPEDIPEPGRPGFVEAVRDLVEQSVLLAEGGTFVLFTAYSMLRRVHAELAPVLQAHGHQVLRQGEASRHKLLQKFSQDPTSVLFATDSFWEGVDVPGRALEQVIIARLPFRVPTEPILEARAEAIADAGGNPFLEYTVPQAVIRFRQGFGRLIRQRTDRGVVLILDSRVIKRNYGRTFLQSLPDVPVTTLPGAELGAALKAFWSRSKAGDA